MNFIRKRVLEYKKLLVSSLVLATINQLFSLVNPQIFRILIDEYANKVAELDQSTFVQWILFWSAVSVWAALVSRTAKTFQDYYVNTMSQKIWANVYIEGVEYAFGLPYRVFEDRQSGSLLDKLLKARTDIQKVLNSLIQSVFLTGIGMLFVLVYAFWVNRMIWLMFLTLVPILAYSTIKISSGIKGAQTKIVKISSELSGSTVENIKNVTLIKSLWLEAQESKHLASVNQQLIDLEIDKLKLVKRLSFSQGTIIQFLRTVLQAVMLWFVYTWAISVWEFFSLLFYSFLIFNPLYELPTVAQNIQEAKASSKTLQDIFALKLEADQQLGTKITHVTDIAVKDVTFAYTDTPAVSNISWEVHAGETIAFVWPSGAGKSTVLKLLSGLYIADSGDIYINNTKILDISLRSFKSHLGIVAQDAQLFTGTIRHNLKFVAPAASDEDCIQALKYAQLRDMVADHADGLDAKIGEWWLKLSWWQKQRLAIARALLRNPDVLIFDEATSSLDSIVEWKITETIKDISTHQPDLMMILVAHRLSTVMHADRIYVLEAGHIVESGTHQELLEEKWLYYALWRQQGGR